MQYQNPPDREPISGARSQAVYDEAAGGTAMPSTTDNAFMASSGAQGNGAGDEGPNMNQSDLISPMNVNEPIEGILISEEEKRIAPILEIKILEGADSLVGT